MSDEVRDHIFISYASEDSEFAIWLTQKLTCEGYAVWCDKFKELGGESYPKDIDQAIKYKTFRFMALMSRKSNTKQNPMKERTLAITLAKSLQEDDFVIPLNIDGISPSEINWMVSDINFIPFYKSWALGLGQLLKKLNSINAPRPISEGKEIIARGYLNTDSLNATPENVYINSIPFIKIPNTIKVYTTEISIDKKEETQWAFYKTTQNGEKLAISFSPPPEKLNREYYTHFVKDESTGAEYINGIPSKNIISNLLLKSMQLACYNSGLKDIIINDRTIIYFSKGILDGDKIKFITYDGRKSRVNVYGERNRRINGVPTKYRFYLAPKFKIYKEADGSYYASLRVGLHITDLNDLPLTPKQSNARRKSICKNWWNYQWLNRHLAVLSFLSHGAENIVIGDYPDSQVILSTKFIEKSAPFGIDETKLNDKNHGVE